MKFLKDDSSSDDDEFKLPNTTKEMSSKKMNMPDINMTSRDKGVVKVESIV
jgi:hypothetical protein